MDYNSLKENIGKKYKLNISAKLKASGHYIQFDGYVGIDDFMHYELDVSVGTDNIVNNVSIELHFKKKGYFKDRILEIIALDSYHMKTRECKNSSEIGISWYKQISFSANSGNSENDSNFISLVDEINKFKGVVDDRLKRVYFAETAFAFVRKYKDLI